MKAIIDHKLYDTETAKKICEYNRLIKGDALLLKPTYFAGICTNTIYKTKKGRFFDYIEDSGAILLVSEEYVKHILGHIYPDKYIEVFGKVKEG